MTAEQTPLSVPRRVRSGSHLLLRSETWYYRRVVPADVRAAFGCSEVVHSLGTASRVEAERLEKADDVEFEKRLHVARTVSDPLAVGTHIADRIRLQVGSVNPARHLRLALEDVPLTEANREIALETAYQRLGQRFTHQAELQCLLADIGEVLPTTPLPSDVWQQCREGILSLVRYQVGRVTDKPAADPAPAYTMDWAYDKWLRGKNRPQQTVDEAKRHLKEFTVQAKIVLLNEVKRKHLVDWRDDLTDAGSLTPKSVNQRLTLVSAILRAGWRDAEMPEPNLKAIAAPQEDDSGRGAWTHDEMLKAMQQLEPNSWAAWIFLIDLTTGVRLGEPMAAEVSWYDPAGFIHVRDRRRTKKRKLHCLPIIESLRAPLAAYVGGRTDGYLLADAPRPNNPNLKTSHEASKWFGRFFRRHEIHRVIHELRHTWIEEARHSPIPKDIWEIISGHSRLTVSDRYGGQKPDVLAAANEKVCEFLT